MALRNDYEDRGPYLTAKDVARKLGIKIQSVYELADRGTLPDKRVLNRRVWKQEQVDAYLADKAAQKRRPKGSRKPPLNVYGEKAEVFFRKDREEDQIFKFEVPEGYNIRKVHQDSPLTANDRILCFEIPSGYKGPITELPQGPSFAVEAGSPVPPGLLHLPDCCDMATFRKGNLEITLERGESFPPDTGLNGETKSGKKHIIMSPGEATGGSPQVHHLFPTEAPATTPRRCRDCGQPAAPDLTRCQPCANKKALASGQGEDKRTPAEMAHDRLSNWPLKPEVVAK